MYVFWHKLQTFCKIKSNYSKSCGVYSHRQQHITTQEVIHFKTTFMCPENPKTDIPVENSSTIFYKFHTFHTRRLSEKIKIYILTID